VIEPLLLAVARISTYSGSQGLTAATGFFFRREQRLFLITSRHVFSDPDSGHHPDRIELILHTDTVNLTRSVLVSLPLYQARESLWRQGVDSGGEVDVAALELDPAALPKGAVIHAFTPAHLQVELEEIGIGAPLLVVGFPLGFYDTAYNLPVARQAAVASAFGVRFQGQGYFLTDARTHRGTSGAPVVMHDERAGSELPWRLVGIHSAQLDMGNREQGVDESLGLNSAWYADMLIALTE